MTRHEALVPLTHDHHHFLAHANRMQDAATHDAAARRLAADDYVSFYLGKGLRNMREEHELFFPATFFASDAARALVLRALAAHLEMYHQTHRLQQELATGEIAPASLEQLAQILKEHVRFEESELFTAIQNAIPEDELHRLGQTYRRDV
jgi:hypothetical protein